MAIACSTSMARARRVATGVAVLSGFTSKILQRPDQTTQSWSAPLWADESGDRHLLRCHVRPVVRMIEMELGQGHDRPDAEHALHVIDESLGDGWVRIGRRI